MNVSLKQQNKMKHRSSNTAGGYEYSLAKVITEFSLSIAFVSARHFLDATYETVTSTA